MSKVKQYFHDLIYDKKNDATSGLIKILLLTVSCGYGFLITAHDFFYKRGLLRSHNASVQTISVGNITMGGTGKTPFVTMLSERLSKKGKKIGVLIRGYGEDEWKMLEEALRKYGAKVFVGRDRVKSAMEAEKALINIVILDDGFQHRRLKRDIDIVLIDSSNPFGNRHLFPRGVLRENISSLKRADLIVLTKSDKGGANLTALKKELKEIIADKKIINAYHNPKGLTDIKTGGAEELAFLKEKKICLVSAICDASYFRYTAEKCGTQVNLEFVFPDHYAYKQRDLDKIFSECSAKGIDAVITTEKDAAKLKRLNLASLPCRILTLNVELEINEGEKTLDDVLG